MKTFTVQVVIDHRAEDQNFVHTLRRVESVLDEVKSIARGPLIKAVNFNFNEPTVIEAEMFVKDGADIVMVQEWTEQNLLTGIFDIIEINFI